MKNKLGDKCFADSFYWEAIGDKVRMTAEVDGILFDSFEYENEKQWLQDIIQRVYDCAMGMVK